METSLTGWYSFFAWLECPTGWRYLGKCQTTREEIEREFAKQPKRRLQFQGDSVFIS